MGPWDQAAGIAAGGESIPIEGGTSVRKRCGEIGDMRLAL